MIKEEVARLLVDVHDHDDVDDDDENVGAPRPKSKRCMPALVEDGKKVIFLCF